MLSKKITYTSMCAILALSVSACEPGVNAQRMEYSRASMTGFAQTTNERLDSVAKQAVRDGNPAQAVHHYEKLYTNDSKNPETALNYAQVLRQVGHADRALIVLSPFVKIEDKKDGTYITAENPDILLEYASATLAIGRYDRAEMLLQELLRTPEGLELAPQAHNLIGVSLDARAMHEEAEPYYREAIEIWSGSATNPLNNLGLNLAHQGYFEESLNVLQQALVMEPQNEKVAANIDLVRELRSSTTASAKPVALR